MKPNAGITSMPWGSTDGKPVQLYTLTNKAGDQVRISNYGGTVTAWIPAMGNPQRQSIVVGLDSLSDYLQKPPYFGALIGRFGNRIAKGKFTLDGKEYTLATNNGKNHLHGGNKGFDKQVWSVSVYDSTKPELTLTYRSKDGEEGYPGDLAVTVKYSLDPNNDELQITYDATTDKPTPINLTSHCYFNLTGNTANDILHHSLMIYGKEYLPVDSTLIPTGVLKSVQGTPFDFLTATMIGARIDSVPGGYDHNWVLINAASPNPLSRPAAVLSEPTTGRQLEVFTDQPGLQFYSGNFLDGKFHQSGTGSAIAMHTALCLETQHFPDAPNQPKFQSTILKPGTHYQTTTRYWLVAVEK